MHNFINPARILEQIEIAPASAVADFGCGSGYFTTALAQAVGKGGKVYALDVLASALEAIESKKRSAGLTVIETRQVNFEKKNGSKLAGESIDVVVLKDSLFQNKDKLAVLKEAARVLKKEGALLVVEWRKAAKDIGPPQELRLLPEEVKTLAAEAGLLLIKDIKAGDFHFAFLFKK